MVNFISKIQARILNFIKNLLKRIVKIVAIIISSICIISIISCYLNLHIENRNKQQFDSSKMEVHFIDVGQAEAILIIQGNNTMLVDTGKVKSSGKLVKYIKDLGIDKIDVLVITHLHEDHAGGAYSIINSFKIGKIYISDAVCNANIRTITWYTGIRFSKLINELCSLKEIEYSSPKNKNGDFISFELGKANVEFLGPVDDVSDIINNTSIITKITFNNKSILLTGDAEEEEEYELLDCNKNLKADILKVSHHGSATSSVFEFVQAVNPKYAIISAELCNKNGHPVKRVMRQFKKMNIDVYRTDESGTIIVTIGNEITFNKPKGDYFSGNELKESVEEK